MDQQTAQEFEQFVLENRAALEEMAANLRAGEIVQVQFGLDFDSDEPAMSEFALLTYDDGQVEEIDEWPDELDSELLLSLPSDNGTYIFDAVKITITEDPTGGLAWMFENALQVYHSDERLTLLKAVASQNQAEIEALIAQCETERLGKP